MKNSCKTTSVFFLCFILLFLYIYFFVFDGNTKRETEIKKTILIISNRRRSLSDRCRFSTEQLTRTVKCFFSLWSLSVVVFVVVLVVCSFSLASEREGKPVAFGVARFFLLYVFSSWVHRFRVGRTIDTNCRYFQSFSKGDKRLNFLI